MRWVLRGLGGALFLGSLALLAVDEAAAVDTALVPVDPMRAAFFDDATFTLHVRSYLFDQSDNYGDDPAARALGGWAGYQTGWIADILQFGVGDALLTGPDFTAWVFGIMGEGSGAGVTLTAGYRANGSKDDWQTPYGMWPGYTNMIIGVFDRAEEQTLLRGAAYDFGHVGVEGLSLTIMAALDTYVADDLPPVV